VLPSEVEFPNVIWGGEVSLLECVCRQASRELFDDLTGWAFYEDLAAVDLGIIVSPRRVDNIRQSLSGALELDFNVHCGSERAG
jgi:hypothetical protein